MAGRFSVRSASSPRMAIFIKSSPSVRECVVPKLVNVCSVRYVKREMAESGLTTIVADWVRAALENDIRVCEFPADPIGP